MDLALADHQSDIVIGAQRAKGFHDAANFQHRRARSAFTLIIGHFMPCPLALQASFDESGTEKSSRNTA
jgi:hypothetical protein